MAASVLSRFGALFYLSIMGKLAAVEVIYKTPVFWKIITWQLSMHVPGHADISAHAQIVDQPSCTIISKALGLNSGLDLEPALSRSQNHDGHEPLVKNSRYYSLHPF